MLVIVVANGCTCSNRRPYLKQPSLSNNNGQNRVTSVASSSPVWTDDEIKVATTNTDVQYLSYEEKEVIKYCNLVRLYPQKFSKLYLSSPKYINNKNSYVISLLKELSEISPINTLMPNPDLAKAAKAHALDMGQHGTVGHDSSNGTPCAQRVSALYKNFAGECCQYGSKEPLQIVLDLLIDNGVPSLGHREMILRSNANEIGVAIMPHQIYRSNCVLDFGFNNSISFGIF